VADAVFIDFPSWGCFVPLRPGLALCVFVVFSRFDPGPCCLNGFMQLLAQHLGRRQYREIFGHVDAGGAQFQQFDLLGVPAGAENDAQRQILVGCRYS
jgi:hypothetical protein